MLAVGRLPRYGGGGLEREIPDGYPDHAEGRQAAGQCQQVSAGRRVFVRSGLWNLIAAIFSP
jgi:hypothetical protein